MSVPNKVAPPVSVTSQRFTVQIPPSQSTPVKPGNKMGGAWGLKVVLLKYFLNFKIRE